MRTAAALILTLIAAGVSADDNKIPNIKWRADPQPHSRFQGESATGHDPVRQPLIEQMPPVTQAAQAFIYDGDGDDYGVRRPQETIEYQDGDDFILRRAPGFLDSMQEPEDGL